MKTPNSLLLAAFIQPFVLLLLNQCAPTTPSPPPQAAAPVTVSKQHWVQVSSRPPTFYPRGVAADVPTDCRSGDWVLTGDARDTRYFIPCHCPGEIPRQSLVSEAMAARSENKLRQLADNRNAETVFRSLRYSAPLAAP